jgi:m7GpppX diphosphatase
LEHKKEAERIVFEDSDPETGFILLPDLKWDGEAVENLYLVAIVFKKGIKSLRDLTSQHLALLENVYNKGSVSLDCII